jgi:hypothetical protein
VSASRGGDLRADPEHPGGPMPTAVALTDTADVEVRPVFETETGAAGA